MKTNLFWMVGLTLMLGCPSDDGPSGDTEDATSTGPTSSASGSASASGSSTTTPGTDSMSGTTEDPGTTTTGETATGTTDEPTTAATEPTTDATGSGSGSGSGDTGTPADCLQYDNQKECNADKACEWLGQGDVGICSDPENPPCDMIPPMFCENVDGCVLEMKMCVPE